VLRALHRIGTVDDVATDFDAEVAANRTRLGRRRVGGADDLATRLDDILALPNHGDDRTGAHVGHETAEEGLGAQIRVVLLGVFLAHVHHLHRAKGEALASEAGDDFRDESALDAVRPDERRRVVKVSQKKSLGSRLPRRRRRRRRQGRRFESKVSAADRITDYSSIDRIDRIRPVRARASERESQRENETGSSLGVVVARGRTHLIMM